MKLIKKGKVKDIYLTSNNTLIFSFSDRVSAFDVIMREEIPYKGKVLCDFAIYWFNKLNIKNHFLRRIDSNQIEVRRLDIIPIECIVRRYLYGSLYSRYRSHRIDIPDSEYYFKKTNLPLASKLPFLLFDPTTKSEDHDQPISKYKVIDTRVLNEEEYYKIEKLSLDMFLQVEEICSSSNFILSDIKFEFGKDEQTGEIILADSLGPDEFRIWNKEDYKIGRVQESYDKQILRDWLEEVGFKKEVENCNITNKIPVPPRLPTEVIDKITFRYMSAYERITKSSFKKISNI